jgi:putative endonuclease
VSTLSPTQATGSAAEEAAANFLLRQGMQIVARNYRTRLGEIDLVARHGETLVFVEVRLRRASERFGGAAASIDARKRSRIICAARHFLTQVRPVPPCRFDVVTLDDSGPTWLRAAFELY